MTIHWFLSKTVREATDMRSQVRSLLNEQRDLLKPQNIDALNAAIASITAKIKANPGSKELRAEMERLEKTANENLRPYPAGAIRENIKEVMVALATILAFTTFFLQLTKIPTGSMQPTLFGITDENLLDKPDFKIPNFFGRFKDYWVSGVLYDSFIAPVDGALEEYEPPRTIIPFVKKQRFRFAGEWHTIWFPGDGLFTPGESGKRRGVTRQGIVKKGEYVFKMKTVAGDHLLVDRFTYNFRKPQRGEIVVFKTRGIEGLAQDQLYIKRLVGLPNEKIQISDDRHLVINDVPLTAGTPRFEMVYSFDDSKDPILKIENPALRDLERGSARPPYRGHVNEKVCREHFRISGGLAPIFATGQESFTVGPKNYMAMGDNTLNSLDSRAWGDFDRKNLIGKCWFIYWPITDRFGWGYR